METVEKDRELLRKDRIVENLRSSIENYGMLIKEEDDEKWEEVIEIKDEDESMEQREVHSDVAKINEQEMFEIVEFDDIKEEVNEIEEDEQLLTECYPAGNFSDNSYLTEIKQEEVVEPFK